MSEVVMTPESARLEQESAAMKQATRLANRLVAHLVKNGELEPDSSYGFQVCVEEGLSKDVLVRSEDLLGERGWLRVCIRHHKDDVRRLCVMMDTPE